MNAPVAVHRQAALQPPAPCAGRDDAASRQGDAHFTQGSQGGDINKRGSLLDKLRIRYEAVQESSDDRGDVAIDRRRRHLTWTSPTETAEEEGVVGSSLMRRSVTRLPLLLLLMAAGAHAADERRDDWITVTLENDAFFDQDTGYTNGIGLSWAHAGFTEFGPDNIPRWLHYLSKNLYISTMPGKQRAVSYQLSQLIQTPADIDIPTLIEKEAPYAGLLAWSANLHAFDDRVADRLSLTLGVVGPLSGAEQTQKWAHEIISAGEPQGWDHQIDTEPVFQASAERLLRLASFHTDKTVGMDVIGIGNGAVGTIESYLAVGIGGRYGRGLDRSFPTASFLPGRQANPLAGSVTDSWYVFANVQGRFVANDIGINGNTFRDSHSVSIEHWQAAATAGVAFGYKRWAVLFSAIVATDRYETQPDTTRYGALSVTYNY